MSQTTTPSFETLKEIKGFLRCDGEFSPVRLTELSHSGAYIKTALPARIGAVVELRLEVSGNRALICFRTSMPSIPGKPRSTMIT